MSQCPNCGAVVESLKRKSLSYNFYKCPNCNKVFKEQKSDIQTFTLANELQKHTYILYFIVFIVIVNIVLTIIIYLRLY